MRLMKKLATLAIFFRFPPRAAKSSSPRDISLGNLLVHFLRE